MFPILLTAMLLPPFRRVKVIPLTLFLRVGAKPLVIKPGIEVVATVPALTDTVEAAKLFEAKNG
jgi:hypothetical protein